MADAVALLRENELREHLYELRRISTLEKQLKAEREKHTAAALPLLREVGSLMIEDPTDGTTKVTNVIEAERLTIDAGELMDALIEHFGDETEAGAVWFDVLKPREVDTKDGGLFHQAVEAGRIPMEVVAKVAKYKKSAAYVGFSKPGG